MSEMVERMARAILAEIRGRDFGTDDRDWTDCERAARAAIEAMRTPTDAMITAGADADIPGGDWGEPTFRESSVDKKDVPVIWQAMIDEALKP